MTDDEICEWTDAMMERVAAVVANTDWGDEDSDESTTRALAQLRLIVEEAFRRGYSNGVADESLRYEKGDV